MSGIFGGGGKSISNETPRIGALRVQTSAFGMVVPLVYGRNRISANLIYYTDFKAIKHTETQKTGGKGGGGGGSSTNIWYSYTAALAMGLCEGVVSGISHVWKGKEKSNLSALGFTLFQGTYAQTAWSYTTTNHPTEAIAYRGLAYLAAPAYDLGENASIENHSFVVNAVLNNSFGGTDAYGAKVEEIVPDFLTNSKYGAGWSAGKMGDYTKIGEYALAAGLVLSPVYSEQRGANEILDELAMATNGAFVWSEGKLKMLPYCDTAIIGSWGNYTPANPVLYNLNDDDYLEPIQVRRNTQADAYNKVSVEFIDSLNDFNVAIAEAYDQANIEQYGLRPMEPVKLHMLTKKEMARTAAQNILQRALYIRNRYEFSLGVRYSLLEPMDVVTLTDTTLGLNLAPARIIEVEELPDGTFNVIAEEMPDGVSYSALYPSQTNEGYKVDFNVASGNANAPVIFEPPTSLSGKPQIWIGASGGDNWGGCEVWVSQDDATYQQIGIITAPARHGIASLASGSDPDTVNTMAVNMTVSKGELLGGTLADRDQMNTLCYIGGELVSFQNATLTGAYQYNVTSLRRGAYGTQISAHAAGSAFMRIDPAVFKYEYDPALIGSTIYIKLRSFNVYGLARQDLAGLTPIPYAIAGAYLGSIQGLALAQPFNGSSLKVKWDAYTGADSYRLEIWQGGSLKRTVNGITSTFHEYTAEDMKADGGPWRSVDVRLYAVSANGASLSAATMTVSNPQAAAPSGLNATAGPLAITVSASKSTDTDYAGMLIFASSTSGFTPDTTAWTNLVHDGQNNSHTFTGLSSGVPMYYRVAFYDLYGKDGLNLSSELTATPMGAGGIQIVSSLPVGGVDGDVVSLTTDHKIYRYNQLAGQWQTWVDGSDILASSITTGKLAANSVLANNIDVTTLSAISAVLGTISSGNITLDSSSYIRGGHTAYNNGGATGQGFFLGYEGGAYKFSLGDPNGQYLRWNGTELQTNGLSKMGGIAMYDTAGVFTFTVPAGVKKVFVAQIIGGGGGGGGKGSTNSRPGAGGGGGQVKQWVEVGGFTGSGLETVNVTVGAGGTAGANGGSTGGNGGNGGASSFGAFVSCAGGYGGRGYTGGTITAGAPADWATANVGGLSANFCFGGGNVLRMNCLAPRTVNVGGVNVVVNDIPTMGCAGHGGRDGNNSKAGADGRVVIVW